MLVLLFMFQRSLLVSLLYVIKVTAEHEAVVREMNVMRQHERNDLWCVPNVAYNNDYKLVYIKGDITDREW